MICGWVNHKKITLLWPTISNKEFQFLASLFYCLHQHLFATCFLFKSSQLFVYYNILLVWPMHFLIWYIWSNKDDFQQYINFGHCIGKIWCHTYDVCQVDMSQFPTVAVKDLNPGIPILSSLSYRPHQHLLGTCHI